MPKEPRAVLDTIFAFPPNRETLGGTAYFIVENNANFLIDCPGWNESTQEFLRGFGGADSLLITHRGAIGKAKEIFDATGCQVFIQEQIAYLLPNVPVTSFAQELEIVPNLTMIWTPGHCPGSACAYYCGYGGVLFTGRHLLPNSHGELMPLRMSKTFHWPRQLRSLARLQEKFSADNLTYICPGANTGFLRGKGAIEQGGDRLREIDINTLSDAASIL